MHEMPAVITHNYHPARGALQNLCCLPRGEAEAILSEIRAAGLARLRQDYLERRLETERWLLGECTRKLGPPHLAHPLYFFLGDFADGLDPARPASLVMPLAVLPPDVVTFTYPDSMASLPLGKERGDSGDRKPYHGQVFTLAEIKDVVAAYGLPGDRWKTDPPLCYDRFIEVQVWDDRPVRDYLKQQAAS
ncbi:MAG: hypothetical protein ACFCUW_09680 [Kiloniellaceae bacterium]